MRLNRSALERVNDRILQFGLGTPGGADRAGIRNRYVALFIHGLGGKRNEIARPHTGLLRNEQPACLRLKYCNAQRIANAKANVWGGATISKFADEPRRELGQHLDDV